MDFYLNTSINELYSNGIISIRTFHGLRLAGVKTLGDVYYNFDSPQKLLHIRNFGRKSLSEVENVLNRIILKNAGSCPITKEEKFAALGDSLVEIIKEAYTITTNGDTNTKKYLKNSYPHPNDMHELVMGELDKMLEVVEGYSLNENLEIRRSLKQFIQLVLDKMEDGMLIQNSLYGEYKKKYISFSMEMTHFSYEQKAKYFLSPLAMEYLQTLYQEQINAKLGTRSQNFVRQFVPHFSDLIKYAEYPLTYYNNICPGKSMRKTLSELYEFNQCFKWDFNRVSKYSDEEIKRESLKRYYPYLSSRQRNFVFDFTQLTQHPPLFYLMFHYLRISENKSNIIYSMLHGIFDGKRRTLNEIADSMNISRERVRQISIKTIEIQDSALVCDNGWLLYNELFSLPFIYEKTEVYKKIIEAEHLPYDFNAFASLVILVADFKEIEVKGRIILMNNKYKNNKTTICLNTLKNIIKARYTVDTYVPISSIVSNVPEQFKPEMQTLLRYVAEDVYKIQITGNQLFLPKNYIDISEELYDILFQRGEPMHVEEIFIEFKKRYPEHKYTNPLQLKPYLLKNKHIKAIGKSSRYALDNWEGIYFGSIRDLLVDLLSSSDLPLHINQLYDGVLKYYPNTTKASLAATMEDENLQRFVEFEGGYFGLTAKGYPKEYKEAGPIQRFNFEERFQMFKEFIETYHRFPGYNGSAQEASLVRWYYNVTTEQVSVTEEQKELLTKVLNLYDELGYPRTATENDFLIKCRDVKDYIRLYHMLPQNSTSPELYSWLRRSRENYDSFTDKRRQYLTDLLNYILSLGFCI